jgi:nitrate/nitrite-specific signal transduction histidine kinase
MNEIHLLTKVVDQRPQMENEIPQFMCALLELLNEMMPVNQDRKIRVSFDDFEAKTPGFCDTNSAKRLCHQSDTCFNVEVGWQNNSQSILSNADMELIKLVASVGGALIQATGQNCNHCNRRDTLRTQLRDETNELRDTLHDLNRETLNRKAAVERAQNAEMALTGLVHDLSLADEEEKRVLATDLQDHIGRTLNFIHSKLKAMKLSPAGQEDLNELLDLVYRAMQSSQSLGFDLSPPILYENGLSSALTWLVDRYSQQDGLSLILDDSDADYSGLNAETSILLFKSIRELLINVIKHAEACCVTISVRRTITDLELSVSDDGRGIFSKDAEENTEFEQLGLFSIRERMASLDGSCQVKSVPGKGTTVNLRVPL